MKQYRVPSLVGYFFYYRASFLWLIIGLFGAYIYVAFFVTMGRTDQSDPITQPELVVLGFLLPVIRAVQMRTIPFITGTWFSDPSFQEIHPAGHYTGRRVVHSSPPGCNFVFNIIFNILFTIAATLIFYWFIEAFAQLIYLLRAAWAWARGCRFQRRSSLWGNRWPEMNYKCISSDGFTYVSIPTWDGIKNAWQSVYQDPTTRPTLVAATCNQPIIGDQLGRLAAVGLLLWTIATGDLTKLYSDSKNDEAEKTEENNGGGNPQQDETPDDEEENSSPGTPLSRGKRLKEFYKRLKALSPASSADEAIENITRTIDEVEDELSGIPRNPNPDMTTNNGRMYPPQADNIIPDPDVSGGYIVRTAKQKIYISPDGGIRIVELVGTNAGQTILSIPGGGIP